MMTGKNISLRYKSKKGSPYVLKDVSLELRKGRITTLMGQSGAGKTTLLKCIANLLSDYEGVIACDETDIKTLSPAQRASTIGFVHQQFHLFPHLTVLGNCSYALRHVLGLSPTEAEARVLETLDILGMQAFAPALPAQLSGGQQQRVAIARALVLQPEVLLLDEPTSALDPDSKKSLEGLLLDLHARGITIAVSSHDMPFIRKIMDYVYFMENGALVETWDRQEEVLASKNKIKQFLSE